jgi:tetratricopeptide (TPR) repeat protein
VSVQLINANNDEHIWAEDYDRDLTDVFAIQTDLAQKIASALQAKLSPNEKERLDRRPTQDSDAYLLYIQAHNYANRPDRLRESSLKAEELFEQAIKLDPKFAAAFAGLSMVQSWMYHESEPTPARREKARLNANEALRLQPDLPEGHLALGYSYYYGDRDYERALAEFEIAKRDLPNEADAYVAIAAIQRRQGKWAESNANFEKAASLDPKNANVLFNFGFNYWAQRDFQTADKILDRAIAADPQSVGAHGMKSALAIAWKGDVTFAENQLSLVPPGFDPDGLVTSARVWVLTLQRKFAEALQMTQQFRGETLTYPEKGRCPKALLEGSLYPAFFALWLAIGIVVGDRTNFPIPLESRRGVSGLVALIPFATAVIALFASKNLRVINAATPSAWLIAIQTYRIAGIMFVFPFLTYGIIPAGFAYPAGIGDALTGIFAPIVALIVARNRPNAFMWALAWNLFGTLDLIVAPATALYFQARVLNIYPLALVPLFLGPPLGILTHILSLRNLAVARTAVPVKA